MSDPSTYSGAIRFTITSRTDEEAMGELVIDDGVLNPFGTVHAGALVWFADVVATTLVLGEGGITPGQPGFPLAVNLTVQLLSNRSSGMLSARAAYVRRGRRVSVVRTVVVDEQDRELLELTSTHIASV